jgi:hypothetical protein
LHRAAPPSLFTIAAARLFAFRFAAVHASPFSTRRRAYFLRRAAPFSPSFSPASPPRRRWGCIQTRRADRETSAGATCFIANRDF